MNSKISSTWIRSISAINSSSEGDSPRFNSFEKVNVVFYFNIAEKLKF